MAISDKLTYLNETKLKIKDGLNNLGAGITTEPFREYADMIEGLYDEWPKVSDENTILSLENTKKAPMSIEYKGNTSQTGTPTPSSPIDVNVVSGDNTIYVEGKNLFDKDNANIVNGYLSSSIMRIGSTSTDRMFYIPCGANTTYTVSRSVKTGTFRVATYDSTPFPTMTSTNTDYSRSGYIANNNATEITITTGANAKYLVVHYGNTNNDSNIQESLNTIQVEKGSSATTYEPYKGNTYPIDLYKNLFDYTTATFYNTNYVSVETSNNTITATTTQTRSNNDLFFMTKIPDDYLVNGQTYTISSENVSGVYQDLKLQLRNKNGGSAGKTSANSVVYDSTYSLYIVGNPFASSNVSVPSGSVCVIKNVQVEKGSSATSYNDFFTPIELCKIGTYQDKIYKQNGKWYLHKEIGKVVFNGSETGWGDITQSGGVNRIAITIDIIKGYSDTNRHTGYFICSHFKPDTGNAVGNVYQYQRQMIFYPTSDITTKADFVSWLNTNNVDFYYVLETPTNTLIEDTTLIEQLEEIKESQDGVTNISQVNNDLPFVLDVSVLMKG